MSDATLQKPDWFNRHGQKMMLVDSVLGEQLAIASPNAARLSIFRAGKKDWFVVWIMQFGPFNQHVQGQLRFSPYELAAAFGLRTLDPDPRDAWMQSRWEFAAAVQGRFIMQGPYLNIPGPGTGNDGDPNISIETDPEIRNAVTMLLGIE